MRQYFLAMASLAGREGCLGLVCHHVRAMRVIEASGELGSLSDKARRSTLNQKRYLLVGPDWLPRSLRLFNQAGQIQVV